MSKLLKLLVFPVLVSSCGTTIQQPFHNYHEIKDRIIEWNQLFIQSEEYYLIYFYSEKCGHCNEIKQDILDYYFESVTKMYFVCADYEVVTGPKADLKGIDKLDEFYIFGTPFLLEVKDHKVLDYYAGPSEILGFISI